MNFLELAKSRYSVRKFTAEPVSEEDLNTILEAARIAPTACNRQPQHIFAAVSPEARAAVATATACHFDAPVLLVVTYDRTISWHREFDHADYGTADVAISVTQMMLQAHELGLGSTYVAWFDPAKLAAALKLPENLVPAAILPLGHPAPDAEPAKMHGQKKSLAE
ncbi:MAG: nitroreductase family protein, partial [Victivallales bacterium]|nr:nitroreductase family protein [Victivallales bacterium]